MTKDNHYKVGDEVWYVSGTGIAIKAKVTELEDWRTTHKNLEAYVFYWIDEVVGNAIDICDTPSCIGEAYTTKELAKQVLLKERKDRLDCFEDAKADLNLSTENLKVKLDEIDRFIIQTTKGETLENYRRRTIGFIKNTHLAAASEEDKQKVEEEWVEQEKMYRPKKRLSEWFNAEDIDAGRV